MKNRIQLSKRLFFAFAILFGLTTISLLMLSQSGYFRGTDNQNKITRELSKNQTISDKSHAILPKKMDEKENQQQADIRKAQEDLGKENVRPQLKSELIVETERIVEGVGLSEKELRALHAKQRQEIEQMQMDLESIVIVPSEEDGRGYTLGELLALHEHQKQVIANADDLDEIVIPAFNEGYPGLSRSDLIELHKKQRLAIENSQAWDEIVIPDSENGYADLSWDEVATIQEQQSDEILEMDADPYDFAAPYPEDGGPDMTVQELRTLHTKQSVN